MNTNYIYLLQEREFIKTGENIYKVGRTERSNFKRFNQYPKGSVLIFQIICDNCKSNEKLIIKQLKKQFKQRRDIGTEYFEGDCLEIINAVYSNIKITKKIYIMKKPKKSPKEKDTEGKEKDTEGKEKENQHITVFLDQYIESAYTRTEDEEYSDNVGRKPHRDSVSDNNGLQNATLKPKAKDLYLSYSQ